MGSPTFAMGDAGDIITHLIAVKTEKRPKRSSKSCQAVRLPRPPEAEIDCWIPSSLKKKHLHNLEIYIQQLEPTLKPPIPTRMIQA
jgi:hypothetical protein